MEHKLYCTLYPPSVTWHCGFMVLLLLAAGPQIARGEPEGPTVTTDPAAEPIPMRAPAAIDPPDPGPTTSAPAQADETRSAGGPADGRPTYDLLRTKQLAGDPFGVRTALRDLGVTLEPTLWVIYQQNYKGGVETHNADDVAGKWHYELTFDFQKMGLIPGGSFRTRLIQSWNDGIQDEVGSLTQPYYSAGSSGDHYFGDNACILADKWWYQQEWLDGKVELRLGKQQAYKDLFDANAFAGDYGRQFMNRALYWNTTVPGVKGIGAYLRVRPVKSFYVSAGAFDPQQRTTRTGFDTAFHGRAWFTGYAETGVSPEFQTAGGRLPGNYRFGLWYDPVVRTVYRDTLGGARRAPREGGDVGFYTSMDQMLWKENPDRDDDQGLGVFFRYGWAPDDARLIGHSWSVGLQHRGLIPSRDADVLGFGFAQSILSRRYRGEIQPLADRESIWELYYRIQVFPWMEVTPDVQVIANPGGLKSARDAIVGGVRVRVTL